jgi:hypothetical protein
LSQLRVSYRYEVSRFAVIRLNSDATVIFIYKDVN